jgi:hypothetical protein
MVERSRPDLKERVLAAARQLPSGVRAQARSDVRTILVSAAALSLVLFVALHGLSHFAGRPPWFLATSLSIWASVATISARSAWRWARAFHVGSGAQLVTVALGTPALLMAVSLALARLVPGPANVGAAVSALPCLAMTLIAALYPLVALSLLRRSTDPLHPIAGGAALGAASGAAAGVMVDLWCPVTEVTHVLSAHVLPVLALSVVGALLGDHVLAMRASAAVLAARSPPDRRGQRSGQWKEAMIAKRFVSCDVNPMGDCDAGDRTPSVGMGGSGSAGAGWHREP